MAILGLFQGNIVLLGCVSAIIDFGILCSLWIFTVNFPLTKTPGCSFVRTKCVINTVWKSDILSNDAGHWPLSLLKMSLFCWCFSIMLLVQISYEKMMELKKGKLQMMNASLTLQSCYRTCTNPVFQMNPWKKTAQVKSNHIQKKTIVRLEILSGVRVVNTNQWLLMQKAFVV